MSSFGTPVRDALTSRYNNLQSTSQGYQQQFWRLKAKSTASQLEQLRKDNQLLNKKAIQMARVEQELREKIAYYQDDWKKRSRQLSSQRTGEKASDGIREDRMTSTGELERMIKEIRVIKNTHEVQMNKVQEKNKKLKKIVAQLETLKSQSQKYEEKSKQVKKLNEQVAQLKKKLVSSEDISNRLRDQKAKVMTDNEALRRDIQEAKLREKMAQKEEEEKLMDYKKRLEELTELQASKKKFSQLQRTEENKIELSSIPALTPRDFQLTEPYDEEKQKAYQQSKQEIERLKSQILTFTKKQNDSKQDKISRQNQRLSSQIKLKKVQGELEEANKELKDVLKKLSPLLSKKQEQSYSKENAQTKASLSILEIFLKKYKIQAF